MPDWLLLSTSQSTLSPLHKHSSTPAPPSLPPSQPLISSRGSAESRLPSDTAGWRCWWLEGGWWEGWLAAIITCDCLWFLFSEVVWYKAAVQIRRTVWGLGSCVAFEIWHVVFSFFSPFVFFLLQPFSLLLDMRLLFYPDKHILSKKKKKSLLLPLIPIMATSQITHCILTPPAVSGFRMSAKNTKSAHLCCHFSSLFLFFWCLIFFACSKRYLRFLKTVSYVSLLEFLIRIHPSPAVCTWSVLDILVAEMRWCQALSALEAELRGESPQVDQLPSMHKLAVTPPTCRPTCFVLSTQQQSLLVSVCPFSLYFLFTWPRTVRSYFYPPEFPCSLHFWNDELKQSK